MLSVPTGCQLFNERFIALWQKDQYRDYLYPKDEAVPEGRDVLNQLIMGESLSLKANEPPPVPQASSADAGRAHLGSSFDLKVDDASDLNALNIQPDKLKELLMKKPELVAQLQEALNDPGQG